MKPRPILNSTASLRTSSAGFFEALLMISFSNSVISLIGWNWAANVGIAENSRKMNTIGAVILFTPLPHLVLVGGVRSLIWFLWSSWLFGLGVMGLIFCQRRFIGC